MTIYARDVLAEIGGYCWEKYGVATRRIAPPTRGGEEAEEIHTRASSPNGGYYLDRDGTLRQAGTNVLRPMWLDPLSAGTRKPYVFLETVGTNVVLHNRDLTNGAWTPSNTTPAKDQVGIDGVTNSASSLSATAGNGTILQSITLASSQRTQSVWIKRLTGTGVIEMTTDNGSTWTPVTVTTSWTRVRIPAQTLANPIVGLRIVTSGDAVAVDFVQNETGPSMTSEILTTTGAATRAVDRCTMYYPWEPMDASYYVRFVERGTSIGTAADRVLHIGTTGATGVRLSLNTSGSGASSRYRAQYTDAAAATHAATLAATPSFGQQVELLLTVVRATGVITIYQSIDAGSASSATVTAGALASAWAGTVFGLNSQGSGSDGLIAIRLANALRGVHSLDDVRSYYGAGL